MTEKKRIGLRRLVVLPTGFGNVSIFSDKNKKTIKEYLDEKHSTNNSYKKDGNFYSIFGHGFDATKYSMRFAELNDTLMVSSRSPRPEHSRFNGMNGGKIGSPSQGIAKDSFSDSEGTGINPEPSDSEGAL